MNWEKAKQHFSLDDSITYFESAMMSPMINEARDAIIARIQDLGIHGDIDWGKDLKIFYKLLNLIANRINTHKQNLIIVPNTSTAFSFTAQSMRNHFKDDFNIVSAEDEFPSSTVPFNYLGVKTKCVHSKNGRIDIDGIINSIDCNTKAVLVSHVQYGTGFRIDLERLGKKLKELNIYFIVNATQGFPFFPIDVQKMKIDVLTASLHKWSCCGHAGSLFYTSSDFRKTFPSPAAGWLSIESKELIFTDKQTKPICKDSAESYLLGTSNLRIFSGVYESLKVFESFGYQEIMDYILKLGDYLIEKLDKAGYIITSPVHNHAEQSAIVTVKINRSEELKDYLENNKIYVSLRQGSIRISLNIFNNSKEIDLLISFMGKFYE